MDLEIIIIFMSVICRLFVWWHIFELVIIYCFYEHYHVLKGVTDGEMWCFQNPTVDNVDGLLRSQTQVLGVKNSWTNTHENIGSTILLLCACFIFVEHNDMFNWQLLSIFLVKNEVMYRLLNFQCSSNVEQGNGYVSYMT